MSDLTRSFFNYRSGWKIKPKMQGDPAYAEYVQRMAEEQRKLHVPKPKPRRPDGMSEEDFIFSLQSESTKKIIEAQKDPNYKRDWSEPLPENILANPGAATKEELVGERNIGANEILLFESTRRRSKNTLGQSDLSAFDIASRERSAHAFMVSPPALLSEEEMAGIQELKKPTEGIPSSLPPIKQKKEGRNWSLIEMIEWIKGQK